MPALARGESSDCANPALDIFVRLNGILADPFSLEFIILDLTGGEPGVQVFPPSGRQAVTVGIDCPTGHRLAVGQHVADYTVDVVEPVGGHRISWWFTMSSSGQEFTHAEDFTVLATPIPTSADSYCFVQDIRDEGIPVSVIDDAKLQEKLNYASRVIDRLTRNVFSPTGITFRLDGRADRRLTLSMPIISVTEIRIVDAAGGTTLVDPLLYEVYNRHLTQNLREPDDRFDPRIKYIGAGGPGVVNDIYIRSTAGRVWPRGQQNIEIEGFFGFTDWNAGNPQGVTPLEIARACALLTMRNLDDLAAREDRWEEFNRNRITQVTTRDQSLRLGAGAGGSRGAGAYGYLTGDEEIDQILEHFMAPLQIGHT